ncbi:RagB/SusD family nutrient uptake outer membrane protein [Flammeovirga sp. EKP202]|uniref:RagB/SusD family nutrient uptake outer membrane protein n=1 Tax=Flammeovirga sp. EKP202 TaxID=2770592 RepID=UPI00165F2D34|nr:RagB/SusD family nutrient uptake outer membrane protein [Flammeovirga sp. EKP202]MBD0402830.1 RagB/SusD family nutrient uptake outer membrane protein [Flammeovirga sp. EKP202]
MKRIKYIVLSLIIGLSTSACSNYLELERDNHRPEKEIWAHPSTAEGVLLSAYQALPSVYTSYGNDILDCATDNAVTRQIESSLRRMSAGGWNPSSNPIGDWSGSYEVIRNINDFLQKGLAVDYFISDSLRNANYKQRLYGEAHFLRAYYHFNLLKRHGGVATNGRVLGVPIMLGQTSDNTTLPRNTYEEVVAQILKDTEVAMENLPLEYTGSDVDFGESNIGRASQMAAQALRSVVTLYAASPAFADQQDQLSAEEKWGRALYESQKLIDIMNGLPAWDDDIFFDDRLGEPIMRRYANNNDIERKNYPPSLNGQGSTNPSQELVDAFPMANGYPIDHPDSGYDATKPYEGRDERFYATIIHNGTSFKGTTIATHVGGEDHVQVNDFATRTGYYLKKFINPNVSITPGSVSNGRHYIALFRKVEAYLNYAEAANELSGPNTVPPFGRMTAKEAIQVVRQRAKITSDAYLNSIAGREAFRDFIHNERRIELAFENHRFYDIRRWNYSLDAINLPVNGIEINIDQNTLTTSYQKIHVEDRNYQSYMIYGPIPYREVLKGDAIIQNKGW